MQRNLTCAKYLTGNRSNNLWAIWPSPVEYPVLSGRATALNSFSW